MTDDGCMRREREVRSDHPVGMILQQLEEGPHSLTLAEWEELLHRYDPVGMADAPLDDPQVAISQEDRLALYEARAAAGLAVFHPRDVHDLDGVGIQAVKGKRQGGIRTGGAA